MEDKDDIVCSKFVLPFVRQLLWCGARIEEGLVNMLLRRCVVTTLRHGVSVEKGNPPDVRLRTCIRVTLGSTSQ